MKYKNIRGGSFYNNIGYVRCTIRDWINPHSQFNLLGFRIMCLDLNTPNSERKVMRYRNIRGGSFINAIDNTRLRYHPNDRFNNLGFRTVCSNLNTPNNRNIHGGSFYNDVDNMRCTVRINIHPNDYYDGLGFRIIGLRILGEKL